MSFEMHCMSTQSLFGEASMLGHGAGIGYTGPGWAPLTISVWWRGRGFALNPVLASSYSDATTASGSFVVTLLTFAMLWCLVLLIFMSNNNNSYYKAMIIVDIRLRSWFGAAPWWVSQIRPAPVDSFWVFFSRVPFLAITKHDVIRKTGST